MKRMWDSDYGTNNRSAAIDRFLKLGLGNADHVFSGNPQGAERHPTLWFELNAHPRVRLCVRH
jgi:hypothetical protein